MRLKDKSALITGAARGIGKAFAESYVREGAKVAIADIDFEQAKVTAENIGKKAYAVELDVTSIDSIERAIDSVQKKTSGIDILVNNAGVSTWHPLRKSLWIAMNVFLQSMCRGRYSPCRRRPG